MTSLREPADSQPPRFVGYGDASGRWVLLAAILGSGMVFVDGTVVNIALPAIGRDLDVGLQSLTWVINSYGLTLAALILLGGAMADRFGRRRIFIHGVLWFTAASVLCLISPNLETLLAARALQGVGGAMLTPGALAIIHASFVVGDRGRAVGTWSGLATFTGAVSPLLGGWLLAVGSWRWIFAINVPLGLLVLIAARHIPESRDVRATRIDLTGSVFAALALSALTLGLSSWSIKPLVSPSVFGFLTLSTITFGVFVYWERRASNPLVPAALTKSRRFIAVNAATFLFYAALGGLFFWTTIFLQVVVGYSALASGLAFVPMTVVMVALSGRSSAWGQRSGPRVPMVVGPSISAAGVAAFSRLDAGSSYLVDVFPLVLLLTIGLVITVGPLTATALASAADSYTGIASGVNNSVARAGGLLALAALPALVGLDANLDNADALQAAFERAMWICAGLLIAAAVAAIGVGGRVAAIVEESTSSQS